MKAAFLFAFFSATTKNIKNPLQNMKKCAILKYL